jgi:LCP family protein required for cell wall assembly
MNHPSPRHARHQTHTRLLERHRRRWPRRVLVAVNLVVALALIASGSVYGYARLTLASIRTQAAPDLSAPSLGPGAYHGLPAENILLIGNQTRSELTNPKQIAEFGNPKLLSGSLSDVVMILHLDPQNRSASLISIPRDLFAPMPAGSLVGPWGKIDAALNNGANGADNMIKAIHQDFGIQVNHYVELNFDGFMQTVNALGGVRMDFPERLYDPYSLLGIYHTGCQLIHGFQALALVRSRHLQYDPPGVSPADPAAWPHDPLSDLSRIVRDHEFLKALLTRAEHRGLSNPFVAVRFVHALINQIVMDPGLRSQLPQLVERFGHLASASIPTLTIPVTTAGALTGYTYGGVSYGDVDFPEEPADWNAIKSWDPSALVTSRPQQVVVVDGTGAGTGPAQVVTAALARDGLPVGTPGVATVEAATTETLVQYHPGQEPMALDVMKQLRGAVMLDPVSAVPAGRVVVDLGTAVSAAGETVPSTSSSTTPSSASSTTTTVPAPSGVYTSHAHNDLTQFDPRPCKS